MEDWCQISPLVKYLQNQNQHQLIHVSLNTLQFILLTTCSECVRI